MSAEKRRLIEAIQNRRAQMISILSLPLLNAFLASRLGYLETILDPAFAEYKALSLEDKNKAKMLFQSTTKEWNKMDINIAWRTLENLQSGQASKAFFGITANQAFRYLYYSIFFAPTLWASHKIGKSLYSNLVSPLLPLNGTLQELERINQRESKISQIAPLIFAFWMMLEFLGVLKTPNIIFHLLVGMSTFGWLEREFSPIKKREFIYVENTVLETQVVFFRTRRNFSENNENKNIVDLMLKGKTGDQGGNGFFFKNPLEKGYDLKARIGDKKAYFKKEVDADGEITYDHLEQKPDRTQPAPK